MIISYNWLKTYFKKDLPTPEKVADILTFSVFEIESIEEKGADTLIDVKVLPDRAHYALCHRGIAKELAAAINEDIVPPSYKETTTGKTASLQIKIENSADCRRYIGRRVENVAVGPSPKWLVERLESIGQRSINNIVDIANYVMFDINQPLHAFDADKVKGAIQIRRAKEGEIITTLDKKEVTLESDTLIIADDEGPLAIAGIKGGNRAEVDVRTRHIILESANFDPTLIRKTAERLGIKTDASKRFENNLSPELPKLAVDEFSALIHDTNPEARFGDIVDEYPMRYEVTPVVVRVADISSRLGISISEDDVVSILKRLGTDVERKGGGELVVTPPFYRLDMCIPEDIVEEVGRLYGYDKIEEKLPPQSDAQPIINKQFYWEYKIRSFFAEHGFSEVITTSFRETGDIEIEKPLAADKKFLRTDLTKNIESSLSVNLLNAPLFGLKEVRIFEIGKVFDKSGERMSLCAGIAGQKGKKEKSINELIRETRDNLVAFLGAPIQTVCTVDDSGGIILLGGKPIGSINNVDGIFELNLDVVIEILPEPKEWDVTIQKNEGTIFKPFSLYPFIVRDIAVFVPQAIGEGDVWTVIEKALDKAFLVRHDLFDVFEKKFPDGSSKKSYAFRLVFQANDRTLTDEEINQLMTPVTDSLNSNTDWHVR